MPKLFKYITILTVNGTFALFKANAANKTDHRDLAEIVLNVALNNIILTLKL